MGQGGGETIPISASFANATSWSVPQNLYAGTIFNFGNDDSGGEASLEADPYTPTSASATASTALGGNSSAQGGSTSQGSGGEPMLFGLSIQTILLIVLGIFLYIKLK